MLHFLLVSSEVKQPNFFTSDNYIELLRLEEHPVNCSALVAMEKPQLLLHGNQSRSIDRMLLLHFSCVSQGKKK